jgi:hypothetical protein
MNDLGRPFRIGREIAKNLAMGVPVIRSLRGSRSKALNLKQAAEYGRDISRLFQRSFAEFDLPPGWLDGKRVLEVGCGSHLAYLLLFLGMGADSGAGVDRFRDLLPDDELRKLHTAIAETWPPEIRTRVEPLVARSVTEMLGSGRLRYHAPLCIEDAASVISQEFHVAISNGVLGCVKDVGQTFRVLHDALASGGIMIHRINNGYQFRSEGKRGGRLNHLTYSPRIWYLMYSNRGGRNRQPLSTFVRLCEQAGFRDVQVSVLHALPEDEVEAVRGELHPLFRDWPALDLSIHQFLLTARKP